MRLDDFDYALPTESIAQRPVAERDQARLFVLPRSGGAALHRCVGDLPDLLPRGALLVLNDTRVFPARLRGAKPTGGRVELLLIVRLSLQQAETVWTEVWRCLGGASKPLRPGLSITLDGEAVPAAEVLAVHGQEVEVRFHGGEPGGMAAIADRLGEVPLPPYIRRDDGPTAIDRERYQTIYARVPGAVAAPTAGLHFTPGLFEALERRGVERATLTLEVGWGTFAPLECQAIEEVGALHAERYEIPDDCAARIAAARREGRPVIAVGTTTVRALESACAADGMPRAGRGTTDLFIRPGHRFRAVDGLLTNFHLPRSSLLVLVAAFAGRERLLAAYAEAVGLGYRFYSYGDAMLIR